MDVSFDDFSLDHGFFIDRVLTGGRVVKKQSPGVSRLQGFYFRLHPLMSDERGAEITSDVQANHYRKRLIVFGLRLKKIYCPKWHSVVQGKQRVAVNYNKKDE